MQVLLFEAIFFSTSLQGQFQNYFQICVPSPYQGKQDQICKFEVSLNFFRSPKHFDCNTAFTLIVSPLNKGAHGFNKIGNGWMEAAFQTVKLWRSWLFFINKHKLSLFDIMVQWRLRYFRNCNLYLILQFQLLRYISCKITECNLWKKLYRCLRNQHFCKRFHC